MTPLRLIAIGLAISGALSAASHARAVRGRLVIEAAKRRNRRASERSVVEQAEAIARQAATERSRRQHPSQDYPETDG